MRNIKNGNFGWFEKGAMSKIETLGFKKQAPCKLIYIALCSLSAKNKNSYEIEGYKFDIARFSSVSEKTVQRYLPILEELDIIKCSPQDRESNGKYKKVKIWLNKTNLTAGHLGDTSETDGRQMGDCKSDSIKEIKKRKKVKKTILIEKKKFLDFVLLSEEEHSKLITEYGKEQTNLFIEKVNDYIGSKGKKYKSHYFTIRTWMRKEKSTPSSETPPKKEMSEGQKVYIIQKRAELFEKVKRTFDSMQEMGTPIERIKEMCIESFEVESLSLNINLNELINNGVKDPQTGRIQIQQG